MILAIDPAGMTGWCNKDGSGTVDVRPKKGEDMADRILKFRKWVREMLDGIEMVVYEKPGGRNYHPLRCHSHLEAIIMTECVDRGIGFLGLSAAEIKKHATGKGNCNKAAMVAAAKERWPDVDIVDDNQADAMWIYDYSFEVLKICS